MDSYNRKQYTSKHQFRMNPPTMVLIYDYGLDIRLTAVLDTCRTRYITEDTSTVKGKRVHEYLSVERVYMDMVRVLQAV